MTASRARLGLGIWLMAALALAASACSVEDVMEAPDCESGGSYIIVAQSVPTADLVPCFNTLPAGWEITNVRIDQSGTAIRLDSDRAGSGAAQLRYVDDCDREGAVSVPSDQEGANRYELIESVEPDFRARRYYTFVGGCVEWDFDFSADASAALSIELGDALILLTRTEINDIIRENLIDEEL